MIGTSCKPPVLEGGERTAARQEQLDSVRLAGTVLLEEHPATAVEAGQLSLETGIASAA